MALNNLAAQVKKPAAPEPAAKPQSAVITENAIDAARAKVTQGEIAKNASPISAISGQKQTQESSSVDRQQEEALKQQIANEMQNPVKREIPLTWTQQQMMCALSAMQIRYGRPAEAVPYLMMVRKINPQNVEATRLLALSFMRLGRWNEADAMVEEYDHLQKLGGSGVVNGLVLLYRSLVSFKTSRLADAKAWFGKFRQFNKVR